MGDFCFFRLEGPEKFNQGKKSPSDKNNDMATTIALQKHGFWEQFDPVPTEVIKVELVPYDEKWWRAFRTALLKKRIDQVTLCSIVFLILSVAKSCIYHRLDVKTVQRLLLT